MDTTSRKELRLTLMLVWPLLMSVFLIMFGNGLQGTLLSLRGKAEGFPSSVVGLVMSLYYLGYVIGWFIVPKMVNSVGHIRVFAGFASLASTTILLQGLFVDPYIWSVVRLLSGVSFVGLFIVAESWLNNISANHLRAKVLSAYFVVINAGLFLGQFSLNLAPIDQIDLFILISILLSFSLVPITLANKPSPGYEEPEHLPLGKLFKKSPLSVYGIIGMGYIAAGVISIGPIYAEMMGFSHAKIALFVAIYVLGGGTLPIISGALADNFDRRLVIVGGTLLGAVSALVATFIPQAMFISVYCIGGLTASVHSISIAMMNDRLKPSQITSATASMILINGVSACLAPVSLGAVLDIIGTQPFFIIVSGIFVSLLMYGIYRSFVGPDIDVDEQIDYQAIPMRAMLGVSDLATPLEEEPDKYKTLLSRFSNQAAKLMRLRTTAEKDTQIDLDDWDN